jgi:hypothetical protein
MVFDKVIFDKMSEPLFGNESLNKLLPEIEDGTNCTIHQKGTNSELLRPE